MTSPVSWLLPVKNGMPFLRETLESLARQTHRDFVVLAWDNGSTDGSLEELRSWIPARLAGRVIDSQPLPYPESLRALVELADTTFCARIDADDVCEPQRLAVQLSALQENTALHALGSRITPIDESGRPTPLNYPLPETYTGILHRLFETNCISHPSVIFRRAAVLAAGNYRLPAPVEDYDLWLRLAAAGRIANLAQPLLRYRVRSSSVTHLALKAETLANSLDQAWLRNAPVFIGLKNFQSAARLRDKKSRFALPLLWQVARTFQSRDGVSSLERFRLHSFSAACRTHVADADILTKAFLKVVGCRVAQTSP